MKLSKLKVLVVALLTVLSIGTIALSGAEAGYQVYYIKYNVSNNWYTNYIWNYWSRYAWLTDDTPSSQADATPKDNETTPITVTTNNDTTNNDTTTNGTTVNTDTTNNQATKVDTHSLHQYEHKVLDLVNIERQKYGLNPLTMDVELAKVARIKSQDMRDRNYFDHNSPTYGSPFDMMKQFGISYRTAGENIAAGYSSPERVVTGWMNSEGHRKNILNPNFTHLGVGYVTGGSYGTYWTQMFIGK